MATPEYHLQETIIPKLFVGLGGTGSRIVDRIANRASKLDLWEKYLEKLTGFFVVDTNINDQDKLSKKLSRSSRHLIGAIDKQKAVENYKRSQDQRALQWLDENYVPREGILPGAGQIRVESRLGYHFDSARIRGELKSLIDRMLAPNVPARRGEPTFDFYVYLYCTLAGGTGSGCFLPMSYLIHDIIREAGWRPRLIANLMLSTTMLKHVKAELHPDIHANCYAGMKELEFLNKLQYRAGQQEYPDGIEFVFWNNPNNTEPPRVKHGPMFVSFLVDQTKEQVLPNVADALADASFLQLFTPLIENIASEFDNYQKRLANLTVLPGDFQGLGLGHTKNFGAFGTAAIVLPGRALLDFCALRFAEEALRRNITFNFEGAAGAELARTLHKFQIDYSNQEFRRLDENERNKRINQSFIESAQELARLDEKAKETGAYWYRLVHSIDEGVATGAADDQGNPVHEPSKLTAVETQLQADRDEAKKVASIQAESFIFDRHTYASYRDIIGRLRENIRRSDIAIGEKKKGLVSSAKEGEAVEGLKLDPLQHRYLVIRLLDRVKTRLLPQATNIRRECQTQILSNTAVAKRIDDDNYDTLRVGASARKMIGMRDEEAWEGALEEVERSYRKVISAQLAFYDADLQVAQYEGLIAYLEKFATTYAQLSVRANALIQKLRNKGESMLKVEDAADPRLALSIEVFETLTEPKQRLWHEFFETVYCNPAEDSITFNRTRLAEVISAQLKQVQTEDGRFRDRTLDEMIADLESALVAHGKETLRSKIFGGRDPAMNVEEGLKLEAKIVLGEEKATPAAIDEYVDAKLRAFDQLGGVLARMNRSAGESLMDGVVPYRTRLVLFQPGVYGQGFLERLRKMTVSEGHEAGDAAQRAVDFPDPHMILIHDIIAAIPGYYCEQLVGDIENAYLQVAQDESREYNLHIQHTWEHSLPNLNPKRSEITLDWSVKIALEGFLAGIIRPTPSGVIWYDKGAPKKNLGPNLVRALYTLGTFYQDKEKILSRALEGAAQNILDPLTPAQLKERIEKVRAWIIAEQERIALKKSENQATEAEKLTQPVLICLLRLLDKRAERLPPPSSGGSQGEPNPFPEF